MCKLDPAFLKPREAGVLGPNLNLQLSVCSQTVIYPGITALALMIAKLNFYHGHDAKTISPL